MSLESATYISQLVVSNPTGGDPRSSADDHLRLIKSVLQATFTSLSGAVIATQAELNKLSGVNANTADINLLTGIAATSTTLDHFVSGTKLPFYQAAPPTGWTVATVQNDSMMRVVSSSTTGGTSGAGAGHSPILNDRVPLHAHDTEPTWIVAEGTMKENGGGSAYSFGVQYGTGYNTGPNAGNWQPRYMDFCIGSKT